MTERHAVAGAHKQVVAGDACLSTQLALDRHDRGGMVLTISHNARCAVATHMLGCRMTGTACRKSLPGLPKIPCCCVHCVAFSIVILDDGGRRACRKPDSDIKHSRGAYAPAVDPHGQASQHFSMSSHTASEAKGAWASARKKANIGWSCGPPKASAPAGIGRSLIGIAAAEGRLIDVRMLWCYLLACLASATRCARANHTGPFELHAFNVLGDIVGMLG